MEKKKFSKNRNRDRSKPDRKLTFEEMIKQFLKDSAERQKHLSKKENWL